MVGIRADQRWGACVRYLVAGALILAHQTTVRKDPGDRWLWPPYALEPRGNPRKKIIVSGTRSECRVFFRNHGSRTRPVPDVIQPDREAPTNELTSPAAAPDY